METELEPNTPTFEPEMTTKDVPVTEGEVPTVKIPEWTHDEFRKQHLLPLLQSQPDKTEATAKAKKVLKDMFGVDKFGDVPQEDLFALFEAIREAL